MAAPIHSPRLTLLPVTSEYLHAELLHPHMLAQLLHVHVPSSWPPSNWEPHVFRLLIDTLERDPQGVGLCRYVVLRESNELIGTIGAFRWPHSPDEFEVGYEIVPEHQCNGYATEGMRAFLPWLRSLGAARRVIAHTFPELSASLRVLEKLNFIRDGEGLETGTWRFVES